MSVTRGLVSVHRPLQSAALLVAVLVSACTADIPTPIGFVHGEVSGTVYQGLVSGADVILLDETAEGWKPKYETVSDAKGAFFFDTVAEYGHWRLEATGGSYLEEASEIEASLEHYPLELDLGSVTAGDELPELVLSPVSTFTAALARFRAAQGEESPQAALEGARALLDEHFGQMRWQGFVPTDVTGTAAQVLTDEVRAGLLLAGLSQLAKNLAARQGYPPNDLTTAELTTRLAEDLEADGHFDGLGAGGVAIEVLGAPLDGQTLRRDYAVAILGFVASSRNATRLGRADLEAMVTFIWQNTSALFVDAPPPLDLTLPVITLLQPAPGSAAQGSVHIVVEAADPETKISDFRFVAPTALVSRQAVGLGEFTATLQADLDVSPLDDGPITLELHAENGIGLGASLTQTLIVSNTAPAIIVQTPGRLESVKGSLEIVASATPNPTTGFPIAKLTLVEPAGLIDSDATAASLSATWQTDAVDEGPTELVFEVEDTIGARGTLRLPVIVDNRPAPVVSGVALMAGLPIRDAVVVAEAVEPAGQRTIGTGVTGPDGAFSFTLTDENVRGPILLLAKGTPTALYRDLVSGIDLPFADPDSISCFVPTVAAAHDRLLGPWTTLAGALARAYHQRDGMAPQVASYQAEEMISGHLKRPGWPALAVARPPDLTLPVAQTVDSARVALAEVGLVYLARAYSKQATGDPQVYSVGGLVSLLAEDISDGLFDGTLDGTPVAPFASQTLDAEVTRIFLAASIRAFLEDSVIGSVNGQPILDVTTVLGDGMFDAISSDERAIYPTPGVPFDLSGPEIVWNTPLPGADAGEGAIQVAISATDISGMEQLFLESPGVVGTISSTRASLSTWITNDFSTGTPGQVTLVAQARDRLGNQSSSTLTFTRPGPTVTVRALDPATTLSVGPVVGVPFDLEATGTGGFSTAAFGLDEAGLPQGLVGPERAVSPRQTLRRIDPSVVSLDGPLSLSVTHGTVDGASATATLDLIIDRTPPLLTASLAGGISSGGRRWYAASSPGGTMASVELDYSAGDASSSIARLQLSATGLADDGAAISVTPIDIDPACSTCGGRLSLSLFSGVYQLELRVWDDAGNMSVVGPFEAWVDTTAPQLSDFSGTFDNESDQDFVWQGGGPVFVPRSGHVPYSISPASVGEQAWTKTELRLSATTEAEAMLENIPRLHVVANDPGLSVFTPVAALTVESYYEFQDSTGVWQTPTLANGPVVRGWRPLLPVTDPLQLTPTHVELVSTERLGQQILANATSHRVTIRATDAAGNSSSIVYRFRFDLLPAPVAVEVDAAYPANSVTDPQSLYHYSFGAQTIHQLFDPAYQSTFVNGGPRIAHAIIHQPWAGPVKVWIDDTISASITVTKSSGTRFVQGPRHRHECGTPTLLPGCNLAVSPGEPNTPCLTAWSDPARRNVYRLNPPASPNGPMTDCRCTSAPCSGNALRPMSSAAEAAAPRTNPPSFWVVDAAGQALPPVALSTYELASGTYDLYLTTPISTTDPFLSTTVVPTFPGRLAYGTVLESVETYLELSDTTLTTGTPFVKFNTCVNPVTCVSYTTLEKKLVRGDFDVTVDTENSSARVLFNLQTSSARDLTLLARDPDTGAGPDAPNLSLSTYYVTMESEL